MNIKNRVKELKQIAAADLKPHPQNWRVHGEEQKNAIRGILAEVGIAGACLVFEDEPGEFMLIDGHLRAEELTGEEVPCLVLDVDRTEAKKILATYDSISSLATIDVEALQGIIGDVDFENDALAEMLNTLTEGLEDEPTDGLTDDDEVPEPPEDPVTVAGDIWILGDHRLMCGDSTSEEQVEKLMEGAKAADMVFTDPPYGVDYDGGSKKREKLVDDHDGTNIYSAAVPIMAKFCDGPCYTWYADKNPLDLYAAVREYGDIHALIIWVKNNSTFNMNTHYKPRHEPCLYWKPKGSTLRWSGNNAEDTIWEIDREMKNEFHPTQKPTQLGEKAIRNHDAKIVLDLFGGSGSTLIACEKTSRHCRMMELDPKYCDVIITRWQEFTGKRAVHAATGASFSPKP